MSTERQRGIEGRTESGRGWILLAALLVGVLVAGVLAALPYVLSRGWPSKAPVRPAAPSSEEVLCQEFALFKSVGDRRAEELLNPFVVPERPVSPEEAERLDAESLLHQPFHVTEVRPLRNGQRFVLVARGRLFTEPLPVEGLSEPQQRVLINPDIIVEVRDGKVHGIRAQLHID